MTLPSIWNRPIGVNKLGGLCLGVLGMGALIFAIPSAPPTPEKQMANRELTAYAYCETYVQARLKAPKTAEFPSKAVVFQKDATKEDLYYVGAYVDSQNSFGALIRTTWVCTVRDTGNAIVVVDASFQQGGQP